MVRSLWVIGMLIGVTLAGCLDTGPVTPPDGVGTGILEPRELFARNVLVGPGGDAETSLTIGPDGQTILACAHGGFRIPSPLWSSVDGGATWTRQDPQPNPVPSGDCDVAVTSSGSWVMLYDTIASATVAVSDNQGAKWEFNYFAAPPFGGVDRPWLLANGDELLMTYANVMVAEPAIDMFTRSTDGGRTWSAPTPISTADPPERTQTITGHPIAYDGGDTIRVPLARFPNADTFSPTYFEMATSRDHGETWVEEPVLGPVDTDLVLPTMARTGDGTLVFSYGVAGAGATGDTIEVVTSADDGATWGDPIVVASGVHFPGVRAAWIDGRSGASATLTWLSERQEEPKGWQVWTARVDLAQAEPVVFLGALTDPVDRGQIFEFIMVRHDPDDRAHILYLMDDGVECADDPAADRSLQCVRFLSEVDPATYR